MAEFPYLPLFPEKFFADTAHVPGEAAAYYLVLLAHAWLRGGSLPDDDDAIRQMARVSYQKWRTLRLEILPFWHRGPDGRLHQKRLDREWRHVREQIDRRTEKLDAAETLRATAPKPRLPDHHKEQKPTLGGNKINSAHQKFAEQTGKKPNDFLARGQGRARPRNPHPHEDEISASWQRDFVQELPGIAAAAPLRDARGSVASPSPLLSEENHPEPSETGEPSSIDGYAILKALADELRGKTETAIDGPVVRTKADLEAAELERAERERQEAEARLQALQQRAAAPLTVSPVLLSSRLIADTVSQKVKLSRKPRRKRAKPKKSRLIPANHMH